MQGFADLKNSMKWKCNEMFHTWNKPGLALQNSHSNCEGLGRGGGCQTDQWQIVSFPQSGRVFHQSGKTLLFGKNQNLC